MAVIWWENTVLGAMLDVEAKQQVLNKGSKGKDVHPGPRLWALLKQGGQEGEEVPQEGTPPAAVQWRQQCSLYQDRASV